MINETVQVIKALRLAFVGQVILRLSFMYLALWGLDFLDP